MKLNIIMIDFNRFSYIQAWPDKLLGGHMDSDDPKRAPTALDGHIAPGAV